MGKFLFEERIALRKIAIWFGICLSIAILAPLLKVQAFTGTIINAMLISAVLYLGLKSALLLAAIPSLIAFASGNLPFGAMIPFIIVSNAIFVLIFNKYKVGYQIKNFFRVSFLAALLKSVFLLATAYLVLGIFSFKATAQIAFTFGVMQLFTALTGSLLFYLLFWPSSKN